MITAWVSMVDGFQILSPLMSIMHTPILRVPCCDCTRFLQFYRIRTVIPAPPTKRFVTTVSNGLSMLNSTPLCINRLNVSVLSEQILDGIVQSADGRTTFFHFGTRHPSATNCEIISSPTTSSRSASHGIPK